jgi:hypothetical protein
VVAALSFAANFDGSSPLAPLVWPGADPTHVILFDTTPASDYPPIIPSLTSHTSTGAIINVPPGWKGGVVVTLLPGYGPRWNLPIITTGRATFAGASSATLVWTTPLPDVGYSVIPGLPVITDGSGPVAVVVDSTDKAKTGLRVRSSAAFSGYIDVLAFQPGANPLLGAM